jgi:hypothetical protein
VQIALAALATGFLAAPAWFLGLFAADPSWAQYDADFRRWLLLPLLALLVARAALFTPTGRRTAARTHGDAALLPGGGIRCTALLGGVRLDHLCCARHRRPLQGVAQPLSAREHDPDRCVAPACVDASARAGQLESSRKE